MLPFFAALFTPSTLIRSRQLQLIEHSAGRQEQKSPRPAVQLSGAAFKWENKEPAVSGKRELSGKGLVIFEEGNRPEDKHDTENGSCKWCGQPFPLSGYEVGFSQGLAAAQ